MFGINFCYFRALYLRRSSHYSKPRSRRSRESVPCRHCRGHCHSSGILGERDKKTPDGNPIRGKITVRLESEVTEPTRDIFNTLNLTVMTHSSTNLKSTSSLGVCQGTPSHHLLASTDSQNLRLTDVKVPFSQLLRLLRRSL